MKYRVLIEPDEDRVFVATVPSLPGCITQGATRDDALRNIRETIRVYLESLDAHGEPIPPSIPDVTPGILHSDVDTGEAAGREVW
jgi:predicted RNase H-like HicB family nuclease